MERVSRAARRRRPLDGNSERIKLLSLQVDEHDGYLLQKKGFGGHYLQEVTEIRAGTNCAETGTSGAPIAHKSGVIAAVGLGGGVREWGDCSGRRTVLRRVLLHL